MATEYKYDVFISYSRKDYVDDKKNVIQGNVVSQIKNALKEAGISYWFDEDGIERGDKYAKLIVKNIKSSRVFVFISTSNANKSEWTGREIACAHMMKKQIIPVRVDESPYHEDVMLYVAILDYIDYKANPQKGLSDLVKAVKTHIDNEKRVEEQRKKEKEEEDLRKRKAEEVEKRRIQEEKQNLIANLKEEILQADRACKLLDSQIQLKRQEIEAAKIELDEKLGLIERKKAKLDFLLNGINQESSNYANPNIDGNQTQENDNTDFPNNLSKWNWGAFGLPCVWGPYNGLPWAPILIITLFLPIIFVGASVYLGIKGNELSWKKKSWQNVEEFYSAQKKWAKATAIFWISIVIISLSMLLFEILIY